MKYADDLLLYAVTDRAWLGNQTLYEQVEQAIKGGATFVQLREKELDSKAFLEEAVEIHKLCRKYQIPFVINDNVGIALKINADGVHVGQDDMEAGDVRALLKLHVHLLQHEVHHHAFDTGHLGGGQFHFIGAVGAVHIDAIALFHIYILQHIII